jgi:hypothetical protein
LCFNLVKDGSAFIYVAEARVHCVLAVSVNLYFVKKICSRIRQVLKENIVTQDGVAYRARL